MTTTNILVAIGVIVLVVIMFIAMRPADFRVSRTITIPALPAAVFAHVNDLHKWEAWSPWAKLDPNAKSTFAGPPEGPGASMHWAGNKKVGEGTMTITDSKPAETVQLKLEFLKPFKATNTAEFTFKPEGNQTAVTWSMAGRNNFMSKAVGLFLDCEKMVGTDFEKGLASLKSVSEAAAKN